MSRTAVVKLCQHIAGTPELQRRLEIGVKEGAGWELFISVGHEQGYDFTAQEASECFEHERCRRAARESAAHAETHILKRSPGANTELADTTIWRGGSAEGSDSPGSAGELSLNGLRRVALSHDWNIELSDAAADADESVFS